MKTIKTYVKAHWYGELPLVIAYGINFLLITIVYRFLFGFAFKYVGIDTLQGKILISYLFSLGASLLVWGSVGAFRAMNKLKGGMTLIMGLVFFMTLLGTARFYMGIFQ